MDTRDLIQLGGRWYVPISGGGEIGGGGEGDVAGGEGLGPQGGAGGNIPGSEPAPSGEGGPAPEGGPLSGPEPINPDPFTPDTTPTPFEPPDVGVPTAGPGPRTGGTGPGQGYTRGDESTPPGPPAQVGRVDRFPGGPPTRPASIRVSPSAALEGGAQILFGGATLNPLGVLSGIRTIAKGTTSNAGQVDPNTVTTEDPAGQVYGGFYGGQPPAREAPPRDSEPGRRGEIDPTTGMPIAGPVGPGGPGTNARTIVDAVRDFIAGGTGGGGGEGPPALPPFPHIPLPAPPPRFGAGGPATDSTKDILRRAQRYGRDSTLLTGAEGVPYGPTGATGLLAGGGAAQAPATLTPSAATREGTRRSTVTDLLNRQDQQNQERGINETPAPPSIPPPPSNQKDSGKAKSKGGVLTAFDPGPSTTHGTSPQGVALPPGLTLVRQYVTIPYQSVRSPDGRVWIRNIQTGDLDQDLPLAPQDLAGVNPGLSATRRSVL